MRTGRLRRLEIIASLAFTLILVTPGLHAQFAASAMPPVSAYSIPQSHLLQPAELVHILKTAKGANKPLLFQVGSRVLFAESHIPGSQYAGPASRQAGLQLLQVRVNALSRKRFIVIYCGCCPWDHCPNVGPAFEKLKQMGFTNVKVLYLPNNFGADWAAKGYPVE